MDLDPEVQNRLIAQKRRQDAYDAGEYELDDDEGFVCTSDECEWRGLTSPFNDDWGPENDASPTVCPDCGAETVLAGGGPNEAALEQFWPDSDTAEGTE